MTTTTISAENKLTNFKKKVAREYVRSGRFGPYIGKDQNKIIQIATIKRGDCSLPLVGKLRGSGVSKSGQLVGNEEALSNTAYKLSPKYRRNGVLIDNEEREKSQFDLYLEADPALSNWNMERKRDEIIQAFAGIEAGGSYRNFGGVELSGANGSQAATGAELDAYLTANTDRILFGSQKANTTAGDFTASLANIDTTNDKATPDVIELLKRMAESANPLIRPVMINNDEPYFVAFVDSYVHRDLRDNAELRAAMQDALPRSKNNPLFTGGDLMWEGVIIKKIPDMDKFIDSTDTDLWDGVWGANAVGDDLSVAGAAGTRVSPIFLCGAQAVGFGLGKPASFKQRKETDYDHLAGVAISSKDDFKKTFYNGKQHGMVTGFVSAQQDA